MGHQSKEYKDNKVIKRQLKKQQINIFTNNDQLGPIIQIRIQVFPSKDMKLFKTSVDRLNLSFHYHILGPKLY